MEANARLTGLAFAFLPVGQALPARIADTRLIKLVIDPSNPDAIGRPENPPQS